MKKLICILMSMALTAVTVLGFSVPVSADNPNEIIESWTMDKDDGFYSFHVIETGNQWHHSVQEKDFVISYEDGSRDSFRVGYDLMAKNRNYGEISGAAVEINETSRGGIYQVDISIPEDYFTADEFTVTFNGTTIDTADLGAVTEDIEEEETEGEETKEEESEEEETEEDTEEEEIKETETDEKPDKDAVYTGITIDGDFADWAAVSKTAVNDGSIANIAMVFDGEDIFIMMDEPAGSAWNVSAGAGVTADGKFAITSDTGKQSIFYIDTTSVHERDSDVIEGSSIKYGGSHLELRLPASFVKEYNETISLGYFEGNERLIADVANLKGTSSSQKEKNNGGSIAMGDGYYDWAGYPHSTIAYSTADAEGSGALYSNGSTLYIHEITSNSVDHTEHAGNLTTFKMCLNGEDKNDWNNLLMFRLISADASGNTRDSNESELMALAPGDYVFYVADNNVSWGYGNWNVNNEYDIHHTIYGKAYIRVTEAGYEMECDMDLEKLARVYGEKRNTSIDVSDIKKIEVNFERIGNQWISWSGTSTGPVAGVIIAILASFGTAYLYSRRKERFVLEAEAA